MRCEVERLIADAFDVPTTAIVRRPAELAAIVTGHPFGRDTSRSHVVFLAKRPAPKAGGRLVATDHSPDRPSSPGETSTSGTALASRTLASRPRISNACSASREHTATGGRWPRWPSSPQGRRLAPTPSEGGFNGTGKGRFVRRSRL